MISGAVLFPPGASPASKSTVTATGDENGVMVTIHNADRRWDLYLPTDAARRLIYDLHRGVMDAIQAELAA